MSPLVSVVLPTHNRARTLERAIQSVLHQTLSDFELIVVDDRSTDATSSVLRAYAGPKVRVINVRAVLPPRGGAAAARNIGIAASHGAYVAFQDSDDEWLSDKLEKTMTMLDGTGPETGVFYSDMFRIGLNGACTELRAPEVHPGPLINDDTLDYQVLGIGIQSAVIKRGCFEKAGLFDEALPRFVDLELFIRLADRFRFVHSNEMLVRYYAGEGLSTNAQALVTARRYLLKKYRSRLEQQKHHLAKQYLCLALALNEAGEKVAALALVLKALLTAPRHPRIQTQSSEILRTMTSNWFSRHQRTRTVARLLLSTLMARR